MKLWKKMTMIQKFQCNELFCLILIRRSREHDSDDVSDVSMSMDVGGRDEESAKSYARRVDFSRRFEYPTHIVSINMIPPQSSMHEWIISPRAEGVRCFVIAHHNRTVSRRVNGTLLHSFRSIWPGGGIRGGNMKRDTQDNSTIIDCVYNAQRRTYYIVDLLQYRSYALFETTFEFRLWFVRAKLEEMTLKRNAAIRADTNNDYSFNLLPAYELTLSNWSRLYQHIIHTNSMLQRTQTQSQPPDVPCSDDEDADTSTETMSVDDSTGIDVDCRADGILLRHKESFYQSGVSELCLLYRDDQLALMS